MDTEALEAWANTGRGMFIMTKLNADGSDREEPIRGGAEFRCTANERRLHSSRCASRKLNPFANGLLRPINEAAMGGVREAGTGDGVSPWSNAPAAAAAVAAEAPPVPAVPAPIVSEVHVGGVPEGMAMISQAELATLRSMAGIGSPTAAPAPAIEPAPGFQVVGDDGNVHDAPPAPYNPTLPPVPPAPVVDTGPLLFLTVEQEAAIRTGPAPAAAGLLARIDSPIIVEQVLSSAREEGVTQKRLALIQERFIQLDPHVQPVGTASRVVTHGAAAPAPQAVSPVDGVSGPQSSAVPGDAELPQNPAFVPGESDGTKTAVGWVPGDPVPEPLPASMTFPDGSPIVEPT